MGCAGSWRVKPHSLGRPVNVGLMKAEPRDRRARKPSATKPASILGVLPLHGASGRVEVLGTDREQPARLGGHPAGPVACNPRHSRGLEKSTANTNCSMLVDGRLPMQSRPKRARVLTRGERRVMGRPSRSMPQGGLRLRLRCATTAALVDAGRLPEPGCLREGARSYAKVKHVLSQRRGCRTTGSGGEDLLALLAQLTLRPDVPVERHRPDTELPAEFGHKGVRGTATHREPGSTRRDHPQHRGREAGCPDAHAARA